MRFKALSATNLRCFETLNYKPQDEVNLIVGANGSGKTSVLEALGVASLGKSFLANRPRDLIRNGQTGMSLSATVQDGAGAGYRLSVNKAAGETRIVFDGQPVLAASDLASRIPVIVINSKVGDILTESPSNRRALIDRTLFHVEHRYIDHWKNYRLGLRQRNQLLRSGAADAEFAYWDNQLANYAERIDEKRRALVGVLNAGLETHELSSALGQLRWHYAPGWDVEKGMLAELQGSLERDRKAGHTYVGVHRADLVLKADEKLVSKRLSRGQSKYLVVSMFMALARFITAARGFKPVVLIDDLPSELDDKMRARLVDIIQIDSGQQFYTAIRHADLPEVHDTAGDVFHVEHARAAAI